MNSPLPGKNSSDIEITNISAHGVWLLVRQKELFLSYQDFPWFRDQPVSAIFNVQEPSPGHFFWPDIDVYLTREIIENPERFPNAAGKPGANSN